MTCSPLSPYLFNIRNAFWRLFHRLQLSCIFNDIKMLAILESYFITRLISSKEVFIK